MAMEASLCLLFLSFLITSSSGTLVGISYTTTSASAVTMSFLQQSKGLSPSQIRILAADHRILTTLNNYNNDVSVDLYLNKTLAENFITSKASYLVNLLPRVDHIKSIIVSCGSECLSQNEMHSLVSVLKSVHLVLSKISLAREVKVSVAFPLSIFLEKLNDASHEKDLSIILSFIKEINSFVMIEDIIDGELSMGDHFVHSVVERAALAASVLPCKDLPLVLTLKSTVIPISTGLAQFSDRVSKYLEARTEIRERIIALYAQVHTTQDFAQKELEREEEELFPVFRRVVLTKSHHRRTLDDITNPPNTVFPSSPGSSTPIITPPDTPTIITVPSTTNPVTISPANPATMPVTIPSSTPVPLPPTNPATTPGTVPGAQPATNPVTSYPPPLGNVPVVNQQPPPAATNSPASQGQSWCVAKTGAPQSSLQAALDYACGMGGADCSQIQQGGSCYSPVTLQNHASFAFNSYYQKHPGPTSCDFGGSATLVNTNPSTGSCIFPSSAATSSSPTTPTGSPPSTLTPSITTPPASPTTPPPSTPTTSTPTPSTPTAPPTPSSSSGSGTSGYGTPPSVLNSSNPASGTMPGFGFQNPPDVNTTSSSSHSVRQRPLVGYIVLMISFVATRLSLLP